MLDTKVQTFFAQKDWCAGIFAVLFFFWCQQRKLCLGCLFLRLLAQIRIAVNVPLKDLSEVRRDKCKTHKYSVGRAYSC